MKARASGAWSCSEAILSRRGELDRRTDRDDLNCQWLGRRGRSRSVRMGRSANERQNRGIIRLSSLLLVAAAAQIGLAATVASQSLPRDSSDGQTSGQLRRIPIVLARELRDLPAPLSLLDVRPPDDGVAGARLAIDDNNTTGRFLKQEFALEVVQSGSAQQLVAEVTKRVEAGASFVAVDASPQTVTALADSLKGRDALMFNAGSSDDRLRGSDCRPNVVHTAPSRAMLADALAQYLRWKRWQSWFLVLGTEPDDLAFAEALRRAAKRFGLKIVEERAFNDDTGGRRADGRHEQRSERG